MGDIFESSLHLEVQFIAEGHAQGVRDGETLGRKEGRELGLSKGFEVGQEVGFYWGSVQCWRLAQQKQPELFPARSERAIASLEDLLKDFPQHPQDERLQDAMAELRGKYKTTVMLLGLKEQILPQRPLETASLAF